MDECYITGPKMSIVDVMLFCEIETICLMYKRDVPSHLSKVASWYEKLAQEESLKRVNASFKELVVKYDLYYEPGQATPRMQGHNK